MSKARDTLDGLTRTNAPDDGHTHVRQYDQWQPAPLTGYVQANPFGNNTPVICIAEVGVPADNQAGFRSALNQLKTALAEKPFDNILPNLDQG